MPVIKARTRGKQFVRHVTRFDHETNETLYAYAHFLGESPEYVLTQLVDTVLARDKEFLAWRADHAESYVPRRASHHARGARPATTRRPAPVPGHGPTDHTLGEARA